MKLRDEMPIYASGLAGALALAVSTYNVWLQRAQVQAQVWPRVEWTYTNTLEGFSWNLTNAGVGPALIQGVRLTVDGKPIGSTHEALGLLFPEMHSTKELSPEYSSVDGRVLPAGVTIHPVTVAKMQIDDVQLEQMANRITIDVCYCSTLGDCWALRSHVGTVPVSACKGYPHFTN